MNKFSNNLNYNYTNSLVFFCLFCDNIKVVLIMMIYLKYVYLKFYIQEYY